MIFSDLSSSKSNLCHRQKLRCKPWPHLVIDNFLPLTVLREGKAEIAAEMYAFEMEDRGTGRIEYSLLKSETLWKAIYSKQTISLLADVFEVRPKLNRDNLLQLRRMNSDTPEFPIHSDFTATGDSIASFLYLSSNWTNACGGRFRLHTCLDQLEPEVTIEPLENRLIAFRTSREHWHSVQKVFNWERISVLALWDISDILA